jgi:hypothetical protein
MVYQCSVKKLSPYHYLEDTGFTCDNAVEGDIVPPVTKNKNQTRDTLPRAHHSGIADGFPIRFRYRRIMEC